MARLFSALGVRPNEAGFVLLVSLVFLGTQSTQALSANTADTLFFSRFGVEFLPQMFIALGLITMATLLVYSGALGVVARKLVYPGLLAGGAAVMLILRLIVELDQRWVYAALWLVLNVILLVTFTFMWNIAGDVADARSSKRLFPLFASAGIAGGVLGNVATGPLARLLGAENILFVIAVIATATAVVARRVSTEFISVEPSGASPITELRDGMAHTLRSPLLRLLAGAMILASALFISVVFPFSSAVADAFDTEAEIASYLGFFAAAATAATFFVSLFLANRLFARVGVVLAIFVVAVIYVGGFTLWLSSFTLATATAFRFVQWTAVNGIGGTARTAVFNVLRSERRAKVMAFMSAGPFQVGTVVGGLLLWAGQQLLSTTQAFAIGLSLALLYVGIAWRMRSHYTSALVSALRSGLVDVFTSTQSGFTKLAGDADAVGVAERGLADADADIRRLSAHTLGHIGGAEVVAPLMTALTDDDLDVRIAALNALQRLADDPAAARALEPGAVVLVLLPDMGITGGFEDAAAETRARAAAWLLRAGEDEAASALLEGMLQSADVESRVAALRTITMCGWYGDPEALRTMLASSDSRLARMNAARALAAVQGAVPALIEAMKETDPYVRTAAGEAWRDSGGEAAPVLELLNDGPPWSWEPALIALEHRAEEVREDVLAWGAPKVDELAELSAARQCIAGYVGNGEMAALEYIEFLISEIEWRSHRVAVRALAMLEPEESVDLIIRGVRSDDRDARAQALEALESVGGELGRAIVPLLEGEGIKPLDVHEVLGEQCYHPYPWIRALSVRAIKELIRQEWEPMVRAATNDPDEVVRREAIAALASIGGPMTDTLGTLGQMERVLALRRVPTFSSLWPDDLAKLADAAQERAYSAGDVIMEAGEIAHDMAVIVDGNVEIKLGQQRLEYGPGDYLGEVSLLRKSARGATATALEDVRVLALGEEALESLLIEKPEVARSMLASMAERMAQAMDALGERAPS